MAFALFRKITKIILAATIVYTVCSIVVLMWNDGSLAQVLLSNIQSKQWYFILLNMDIYGIFSLPQIL